MTYYVDMNDESSLQEYQLTIINNGQVYLIYNAVMHVKI